MSHFLYQALLVAGGSAAGGLARWLLGLAAVALFGTGFPWGTLLINLTGCLFLGWLWAVLGGRVPPSGDDQRLLFAVGFCGAYTTFSTFSLEADALLKRGSGLLGWVYIAASVILGLLAVRLGIWLGQGPPPAA